MVDFRTLSWIWRKTVFSVISIFLLADPEKFVFQYWPFLILFVQFLYDTKAVFFSFKRDFQQWANTLSKSEIGAGIYNDIAGAH